MLYICVYLPLGMGKAELWHTHSVLCPARSQISMEENPAAARWDMLMLFCSVNICSSQLECTTFCYILCTHPCNWGRVGSLIFPSAGYQCEVDALLCVNRQSQFSQDQEHLNRATELLKQLLDHTSLFPQGTGHQNKYLYVMVQTQTYKCTFHS